MKVYEYVPANSDRYETFKEVSFEDVKDIVVKWPETYYTNQYASEYKGGSNLTIGEIVELGRNIKIYGSKAQKASIKDSSENKIYVYEYGCAIDVA